MLTSPRRNPAYPKNNRLRYVRAVVRMGEPYHGRNSLIILDLRPISHPFEPYAHQYGCMFDTMRYWKINGIVRLNLSLTIDRQI